MHVQWEKYLVEYNSKHSVYFRLHQEMQDTRIKVEGLRQVMQKLHATCIVCHVSCCAATLMMVTLQQPNKYCLVLLLAYASELTEMSASSLVIQGS